jgi:hypothetical protein
VIRSVASTTSTVGSPLLRRHADSTRYPELVSAGTLRLNDYPRPPIDLQAIAHLKHPVDLRLMETAVRIAQQDRGRHRRLIGISVGSSSGLVPGADGGRGGALGAAAPRGPRPHAGYYHDPREIVGRRWAVRPTPNE